MTWKGILTNIFDIVILIDIILNEAENIYNPDVNADGEVNVLDVIFVVDIILNN